MLRIWNQSILIFTFSPIYFSCGIELWPFAWSLARHCTGDHFYLFLTESPSMYFATRTFVRPGLESSSWLWCGTVCHEWWRNSITISKNNISIGFGTSVICAFISNYLRIDQLCTYSFTLITCTFLLNFLLNFVAATYFYLFTYFHAYFSICFYAYLSNYPYSSLLQLTIVCLLIFMLTYTFIYRTNNLLHFMLTYLLK